MKRMSRIYEQITLKVVWLFDKPIETPFNSDELHAMIADDVEEMRKEMSPNTCKTKVLYLTYKGVKCQAKITSEGIQ